MNTLKIGIEKEVKFLVKTPYSRFDFRIRTSSRLNTSGFSAIPNPAPSGALMKPSSIGGRVVTKSWYQP